MAKLKAKHLFDLTFVSDAHLSPDGKQVVAVQTTVVQSDDPPEGEKPPAYRSHLFRYDTALSDTASDTVAPDGGVQLTRSGEANTQPRFSPNGLQLAFVSQRGDGAKAQLYLLPLGGGEARALTDLKGGVGEFAWHPSGRALAPITSIM